MTKNRDIRVFIGIVVAFLLFTVSLASGATITVDDSGGAVVNGLNGFFRPNINK